MREFVEQIGRTEENRERTRELLRDNAALLKRITNILDEHARANDLFPPGIARASSTSAVLFPLGNNCAHSLEPCVLLNKRSVHVKQAGDLCFPGGRTAPLLDSFLSKLLTLPFSPLSGWPPWTWWRRQRPREAGRISLLFATSLRESLEEMRINPLGIRFLGPLPSYGLSMFDRVIYPMVGWVSRQRRFSPNWEVERVVPVPLRDFLDPARYACYRLKMGPRTVQDYPCFLQNKGKKEDLLWGATFRIVMTFLELIFGFRPPPLGALPVVHGSLGKNYLNGSP